MEISLNIDEPVTEDNNINHIPCSINFNGRSKVSSYFKEKTGTDGGNFLSYLAIYQISFLLIECLLCREIGLTQRKTITRL